MAAESINLVEFQEMEMEMMPTFNLENQLVELLENAPAYNLDCLRRFRTACLILHSAVAFSNNATDDGRNNLRDNLLQPQNDDVVVTIEPEFKDLARLKDTVRLHNLGGVTGVAASLGTDPDKGIQGNDSIARRKIQYGLNGVHRKPPRILHILFETIRDPIILVLLICAILALIFGIRRHGKDGLSDGVSICLALVLVIAITAVSNLWPKVQLFKVSKARDEFDIVVKRNSRRETISALDIVVGDVVVLVAGNQVPADGLYLKGNGLQMDESNVGDHSASVKVEDGDNPFLLSGTKVIQGSGSMLVTAVGMNTEWGKMVSMKTRFIAKTGAAVASIVVVVLIFRYFIGNLHGDDGKPHFVPGKTGCPKILDHVIGILATPVTIASTAIPEGLLLAVLIAIAFSAKNMMNLKAQVNNLSACEAIGTTTVICTDESCLTSDHLAVTEFCIADKLKGPEPSCSDIVFSILHQIVFWTEFEDSLDVQVKNAFQEWGDDDLQLDIKKASENYTVHIPETPQAFTWIKDRTDDSLHAHQKGCPEAILPI